MLNLFLHCTLFAWGKCQEFIQACKLILNDCHLFAILLLSWEMCGDVWQKAQITVCNLTELLWETGAQSWLLVDCFCIIVTWTGLKYLDCCLMNSNFVKTFRREAGVQVVERFDTRPLRLPKCPQSAFIVAWGEYVNEKHIVKPFVEPSESWKALHKCRLFTLIT